VRARTALPIALVMLLFGGLAATADARRAPRNFYGVSWDWNLERRSESDAQRQWDLMASSGVESTRVVFSWAAAQPKPGAIGFDHTDRLVARAAWRRIRLLPVVYETPNWAKLDESRRNAPPQHVGDYAHYVRALVSRYGPRGSFWAAHPEIPRRPLREWQIWNEPELPFYWDVPSDWTAAWPRGYVKLLRAARGAIRSVDRRAKIVLAGLSGESWKYLRRLYRARARRLFDVVAIHPYNAALKNVFTVVRLTRRVMARSRDARKPVWVTEVGWPAARGRVDLHVERDLGLRQIVTTDGGMSRRLRSSYRTFVSRRRSKRFGVSRVYWFTWGTPYRTGESGIWEFAGLVKTGSAGFSATPSLSSYRASARRHQGCAKSTTGACR
jgi:hypothetical protein